MVYTKGDFYTFLTAFRVEKGGEFTHTSMAKPTGSFYVPADQLDQFYNIYREAYVNGDDLHVTEKHRDIGPVLIDMDFRQDTLERRYTRDMIVNICKLYFGNLNEYLTLPNEPIDFYVMEKPTPREDKGVVKDGVHIVVPNVVTKPGVQYIIRNKVLEGVGAVLAPMNLKNKVENVIDEAVIHKNNWQMYGSCKPNNTAYKVTFIVSIKKDGTVNVLEPSAEQDGDFTELLSIRNKYDSVTTKTEKLVEVLEYESKKMLKSNPAFQVNQNTKKNVVENLEVVDQMVDLLSVKRADSYEEWIRVGWCLRNIDHRLQDAWIRFSKKSSKFQDGECEKLWNYMKDDGLGIGTLHMWAKQDNPEQYREICKKDLASLVRASVSGTHTDISRVVHFMYKYEFVCVSNKHNMWYEFRQHRWVPCDSGHTLRSKISNEVFCEYHRHISYYSNKAANETSEEEQNRYTEIAKKLLAIASKLKQTSFKDNIMKECRELFYVEKFEEKLDSRCTLVGFDNGVYDLEGGEFRDGQPEDMISFTTGINYVPYDPDSECAKDMMGFLKKIFPKTHMLEYVLTLFASFLNGNIREEKFHIWTGSGCHAINTDILMYDGSIKKVQHVQVGDLLMGDDSTPRTVQRLCRGYSDMYEIIPTKGESFVVNGEHILSLKATNNTSMRYREERKKWSVSWREHDTSLVMINKSKMFNSKEEAEEFLENIYTNTKIVKRGDIIDVTVNNYLKNCKRIGERNLYLYRNKLDYSKQDVPIDPWFLGYWLGNGHSNFTAITTMFPEIVDKIKELYDDKYDVHISDKKGLANTWSICKKNNECLFNIFNHINLINNKHIPRQYLANSRQVRLQVLAGIIDSDGHYHKNSNEYEITFEKEKLLDEVIHLARSLGFACYKSSKTGTWTYNGIKKSKTYYRTIIVGEGIEEIPVVVPKKKAVKRNKNKDVSMVGFKIKRVNDDNFYGFELDKNHRYVMGETMFITHNSNGKSKIVELFERAFGEYCVKFPITLLTQKRVASNAANSELARAKGKRFASLQEPGDDEKLNVGLMKEISGGDKIQARMIYKEPIEFKPQFKMILACNHLPSVPSDDGGTWRRIRVVEFTSRFCEDPDPNNPNEFKADMEVSQKFEDWKEQFMAMLIEYYKQYIAHGIKEPEEVLQCTREYQKNNDCYMDFIESELTKSDDDDILITADVYTCFKMWVVDNAPPQFKNIKKKDFIKAVDKILSKLNSGGKSTLSKNLVQWKGWTFKTQNNATDDL